MMLSAPLQGPPKAINRTGTRFTPAATPGAETPSTTDGSPSISSMAGSDALGQEYSILATPSFTPGVEGSPFITWGDIQGTPLRLDPEDDIDVDPAAASGPQFSIAEVCTINFGLVAAFVVCLLLCQHHRSEESLSPDLLLRDPWTGHV